MRGINNLVSIKSKETDQQSQSAGSYKKKKLKSQNYQKKINTPLLAGEHNYCLAAQHSAEAGPLGLVDSSPQLFYSVLSGVSCALSPQEK